MITVKNPLTLYWLHTSGILDDIRVNLEKRLGIAISLDSMRIRTTGKISLHEVADQFNKEVEDELATYKIESTENISEEGYSQIEEFLEMRYSEDKFKIINCQTQTKQIKNFLENNKLWNLLFEFENYYELVNSVWIFAKRDIFDDVYRIVTRNQLNDSMNSMDPATVYFNKSDISVEDVQLGPKIGEFEGGQLWSCKHKNIPHTYVRFKDSSWQDGAKKKLLHYSHPNFFENLNLFPPMEPLRPSKQKLPQLLSFLKVLQVKYPTHNPSSDSIFESEGKLVIFTKQNNYRLNKGWLCYKVAYGEISYHAYLRWIKHNPNDQIAKYNGIVDQRHKMMPT